MRLKIPKVEIKTSDPFITENFDIGDKRVIMDILRSKMYSDPIQTICQEYPSNARDAHREVGKHHLPIQIKLPNLLDPSFQIRDFGPGIDPNRMSNVFILYGVSTKRNSDEETGGFGLGCKSAFAYSDTFTIVVIVPEVRDERIVNVKRQYIAYIDESRKGAISLVSEEITNEPQGTTIIITPKSGDKAKFEAGIQRACGYWEVKPEILGSSNFEWPQVSYNIESKIKDSDSGCWGIEADGLNAPIVILDGIPYPLALNSIFPQEEESEDSVPQYAIDIFGTKLRMFFNTGELAVTANRESLDYTEETIALLKKRIEAIHKEICDLIAAEMDEAETLWQANISWAKVKKNFAFIEQSAEWKGHKLYTKIKFYTYYSPKKNINFFYYIRNEDGNPKLKSKLEKYRDIYLPCSNNWLVVEDDEEYARPPKSKLNTLLDENPNIDNFGVVRLQDAAYYKQEEFKKKYSWEALKPIKLSTLKKTVRSNPPKLVKISRVKRLTHDGWESKDSIDLKNGSGIYVPLYRNKAIRNREKFHQEEKELVGNTFGHDKLNSVRTKYNIVIYGILERSVGKLSPNWTSLEKFLEKELEKLENDPYIIQYGKYESATTVSLRINKIVKNYADELDDDSLIKELVFLSEKVNKCDRKIQEINFLRSILGQRYWSRNDEKLIELAKKYKERYKLLIHIQHPPAELYKDILLYIKRKDEEAQEERKIKEFEKLTDLLSQTLENQEELICVGNKENYYE